MATATEETRVKEKQLFRRVLDTTDLVIRKDGERKTLAFSASSETPVDRWYGTEVLSHDKQAVRLDRAKRGAMPLLFNHNIDDPVGMISTAKTEDGRLLVEATLFDTARAKEVVAMIDGGLRNVSLAYRVYVVEEEKKSETFTVTDWEPYEVSIVTVPADSTVGVGRGAETEYEVRMVRTSPSATAPPTKEARMADENNASAGAAAVIEEPKISAREAEKKRRTAIINLCKASKIDARVEAQWIEEGTTLNDVADEILGVMEERGKANPTAASKLGLGKKETDRYRVVNVIRALKFPTPQNMEAAGAEMEMSRALAKKLNRSDTGSVLIPGEVLTRSMDPEFMNRAMATTPGSKGGYLVNVENMGFIDILRNRSVLRSMGARVLAGLEGNVVFARQTGKPSVTWQGGEGASVTAADQTLGQLSMTPKTAIVITDVSEQLLRQSNISAEQFIMADLASNIAIDGVDASGIKGTGGAQPLGIKNTTGVTTGQDAAALTYAKLLAFITTAGTSNAIRGNPGWVTNIAGAAIMAQKQRFTSTDTPLWEGNLLDGAAIGFRAMSSEQLESANLIWGSWDELVIGEWGVLELSTDTGGTRFNQAQVGIRAMWMVDIMLRYPQAFVVSTNLAAA